jgi:drug/metabolite transporter (DMT)-like permease
VLPGVYLLISNGEKKHRSHGAGLMIGAALLYALHLLINQRILYEAPAPSVTFYTLLSMSVTVIAAFLISSHLSQTRNFLGSTSLLAFITFPNLD